MTKWREIAEWDWVEFDTGDKLHAPATVDVTDHDDCWAEGTTACGRQGRMWIPGLLTRMSAERCQRCCAATGMPDGPGSPKNDDSCRPLAASRSQLFHDDNERDKLMTLHPATEALLRFFDYDHLPQDLRAISKPFHDLAFDLAMRGERGDLEGAELTMGLRKLLEAKDCIVRAAL